jgi:2-methylaconitate cis-trans-isomerase PrpF
MSAARLRITLMRGGPAQALFVHAHDLPSSPRARDALLLRALGGPDPRGRFVDGVGGAIAGGARIVVVARSQRAGCDLEFLVGAASADAALLDWTVPCGGLAAAVGPFAVHERVFPADDGLARLRLMHATSGERIDAFVPVRRGEVVEEGGFAGDGVPFPGVEIRLEHLAPAGDPFPTRLPREALAVPGLGEVEATLIDVGGPAVFVKADALGLTGRESPEEVARARRALERIEAIRLAAAARLGLGEPARLRPEVPRVAWVAKPAAYRASGGAEVPADAIDLLVRERGPVGAAAGADPADGALAVAVAAAVPGTVVADVARTLPGVATRIGAAAGTAAVGAEVAWRDGAGWRVERCVLSRGARRLMVGEVFVPGPVRTARDAPTGRPAGSAHRA